MSWHVVTVAKADLCAALAAIRSQGGTVTSTTKAGLVVAITYVTVDARRLTA